MFRKMLLCLSLSAALCGCGTLDNMTGGGERRVYGGVRHDLQHVSSGKAGAILDVPLSAVADTVTLPVTVGKALTTAQ